MKTLKTIAIAIGILVMILLALVLTIPLFVDNDYAIEKTQTVDVDKEFAHAYLSDFSNHEEWSPWADIDPDMQIELIGTMGEVGSMYKWHGNKEAGKGSMEITEITPDKISIQLRFEEPFKSESMTFYEFSDHNGKTDITWSMTGSMPYPMNIMILFMDLESAIGEDFEKGLASLKTQLESMASNSYDVQQTVLEEKTYIGVRETISVSDMPAFYEEHMPGAYQIAESHNLEIAGSVSGLYFEWDEDNQLADLAVAIPVADENPAVADYQTWKLGGKAVKLEFYGDYAKLGDAHAAMHQYLQQHNLTAKTPAIQAYIVTSEQEPDTAKWQTNIYYLID